MRWKCTVAYDGTDFEGWQSQLRGNTIQDQIESRLKTLFERDIRVHGSGRTDSGVHATGQVFHFDADWKHGGDKLIRAFRAGLPETIQVERVEAEADDFHARHSATGKRYIYRMFEGWAPPTEVRFCYSLGKRRMDLERMNAAGKLLLGRHDFSAYGASQGEDSGENPVKDLRLLEVVRIGEGPRLELRTEASGYLYKMVRSLAGCLIDVGSGRISVEEVVVLRDAKGRSHRVVTAPPQGLTLEHVYYGDND